MRKQKVVATIKQDDDDDFKLESITTVAFDKAGKYAAMGGKGGVKITTVKEWGATTASLETKYPVSGIVWCKSMLEVSCDRERAVLLYGVVPSSSTSTGDAKMEE